MDRRDFVKLGGAAAAASLCARPASGDGEDAGSMRVRLLANDYITVYESPDPATVYTYSPGICRLQSGRLVATLDLGGPGVQRLESIQTARGPLRGLILTSDDHGETWTPRGRNTMLHARPFVAGSRVYVLGHAGRLRICCSEDWGDTWAPDVDLTTSGGWHQAPCNVHYAEGHVYLVMEHNTDPSFRGWGVSRLAPVLMRGREADELTSPEAWSFAGELSFNQAIERYGAPRMLGTPFFATGNTAPDNLADRRTMNPIGWLETNVVQFTDPAHLWYDPSQTTFHLWMRAHTGGTNLACIAKVTTQPDGSMVTDLQAAPSGEPMLYVPCPGGQMKFHILYDRPTELYWLLSTQSTDSMTRPVLLRPDRYGLPNNERQRLALHFSRNCMDWCFAGLVATGGGPRESRHYASMVIDGENLHVLSRSGDARALSAHDGNLITLHTVRDFRKLVY